MGGLAGEDAGVRRELGGEASQQFDRHWRNRMQSHFPPVNRITRDADILGQPLLRPAERGAEGFEFGGRHVSCTARRPHGGPP